MFDSDRDTPAASKVIGDAAADVDHVLTPAEILAGLLTDVLVVVPMKSLRSLTGREISLVMDWIEVASEKAANQKHVPLPEIRLIRKYLRPSQLAGDWKAFTKSCPAEPAKTQACLF